MQHRELTGRDVHDPAARRELELLARSQEVFVERERRQTDSRLGRLAVEVLDVVGEPVQREQGPARVVSVRAIDAIFPLSGYSMISGVGRRRRSRSERPRRSGCSAGALPRGRAGSERPRPPSAPAPPRATERRRPAQDDQQLLTAVMEVVRRLPPDRAPRLPRRASRRAVAAAACRAPGRSRPSPQPHSTRPAGRTRHPTRCRRSPRGDLKG